ncbi:MAG: hypothetical protein K8R23_05205 [Chthoniobacter sp.]|nr:hypothetical protein [Chthoniobacter sp.]
MRFGLVHRDSFPPFPEHQGRTNAKHCARYGNFFLEANSLISNRIDAIDFIVSHAAIIEWETGVQKGIEGKDSA